jgi:type IV pilus assembly protein PilM
VLRPLFFQKSTLVGLDIQTDAIRLLQLRVIKKQLLIEEAIMMALPAGAIIPGKIQQPELVSDCLRALATRSKIKKLSAAIALPAEYVTSKRIQLNKELCETEREAEIEDNLSHYLPSLSGELFYDYIKLDAHNEIQDNVFLAATQRAQLNIYVSMVENAGIPVSIVDVDIYAIARAVCFSIVDSTKTKLILDLDLNTARFMLLNQNEIIFYQSISRQDVKAFYAQLKHAIQLCLSTYHQFSIGKIFLSGSAQDTFEIISLMEKNFSMEAHYVDIFRNVLFSQETGLKENLSSIVYGLALRGIATC